MEVKRKRALPENAYRELKEGEVYVPIVPSSKVIPEITVRSVFFGVLMAIIFSGAAAFLGLKIGQVFEAAIPIAILAVGIGNLPFFKRKNTILENVIIQSIGAASGVVVAGAIFTLPALFILGLDKLTNLFQIFFVALLGGVLGILFLIPLRRYFVKDMHGKLPFPEATATTEILVAGEEGGEGAKVLALSMLVSGVYNFLMMSFELWKENFSTKFIPIFETLTKKVKLVFSMNVDAAILGLGYIIGVRYALIIAAGSFISWFVLVPLVAYFGAHLQVAIPPVTDGTLISQMSAGDIFTQYVRHIGIGGIFAAGIIGIIKSFGIMMSSMKVGIKQMFALKKEKGGENSTERTDTDIKMGFIFLLFIFTTIVLWVFFRFDILKTQPNPTTLSFIAILVVIVISFLFTTVAARAIAIVGVNPVSGMTLMTLMLTALILIAVGLKGNYGMLAALLIGGVVCTALSTSGGFITDLKIGYWIGATPRNQERWKFLGIAVSAATVGIVIILLNKVYGFVPDANHPKESILAAPQANAMAAVIETFMSGAVVPWILYAVGAILAILMELLGIAPLAFALGMYIPLSLNFPVLVGAIIAHFVRKGDNEELSQRRNEKGTLIASGFIAGGAIIGVIGALLKYFNVNLNSGVAHHDYANYISIIVYALLGTYLYLSARKVKE